MGHISLVDRCSAAALSQCAIEVECAFARAVQRRDDEDFRRNMFATDDGNERELGLSGTLKGSAHTETSATFVGASERGVIKRARRGRRLLRAPRESLLCTRHAMIPPDAGWGLPPSDADTANSRQRDGSGKGAVRQLLAHEGLQASAMGECSPRDDR